MTLPDAETHGHGSRRRCTSFGCRWASDLGQPNFDLVRPANGWTPRPLRIPRFGVLGVADERADFHGLFSRTRSHMPSNGSSGPDRGKITEMY